MGTPTIRHRIAVDSTELYRQIAVTTDAIALEHSTFLHFRFGCELALRSKSGKSFNALVRFTANEMLSNRHGFCPRLLLFATRFTLLLLI